jgi:hypothetical protein
MNSEAGSLSVIVSFHKSGRYLALLPFAVVFVLIGAFTLSLDTPDKPVATAWWCIAAGIGFGLFAVWKRFNPGAPGLTLSPAGIRYRPTSGPIVNIPWNDVQDVTTSDIETFHGRFSATERGVPVVLVTTSFYRAHIELEQMSQRGRAWKYLFIQKGDLVQIAFFPNVFAQSAAELHKAIRSRWLAFGKNPAAKAQRGDG